MSNFLNVIQLEQNNFVLVEKSHVEDFNTKTQLVVNESQEAIFYKDGQALDLFKSGRHTLNTDNVPLLKKMFNAIFNRKTPFTCDVYFINKVNVLDLLWGTDTPITLEDPKYHLIVNVRGNGQSGVRIIDSRKFVVKVVGQLQSFTQDDIKKSIKGILLAHAKSLIANEIVKNNISILEINTKLVELSKILEDRLNEELEEYGLNLTKFFINTITCSNDDLMMLRETKEKYLALTTDIEIEALKEIKLGEAKARARAAQGFTYQDERKFDVLQEAAGNEGSGANLMGAGIGLGMGAGIGAGIGKAAMGIGEAMSAPSNTSAPTGGISCPNCNASLPSGAKFCSQCGTPVPTNKFCTNCGNKVDANAKFCPNCGNKIG